MKQILVIHSDIVIFRQIVNKYLDTGYLILPETLKIALNENGGTVFTVTVYKPETTQEVIG